MAEIITTEDYLWMRVRKDVKAFLAGQERDLELADVGVAICRGLHDHVQNVRDCWAEARRMKAERDQQKGGA